MTSLEPVSAPGDLITKTQEIAAAHNAIQHRDLALIALTTVDDFMRIAVDPLTVSELNVLGERCFRIEATRLGMKPSDIDNHWLTHLDTLRLFELGSKAGSHVFSADFPFELTKTLVPSPESHRVRRLVKWFQRLSHRGISRLIRQRGLREARTALKKRKPTAGEFHSGLEKLSHHRVALRPWKRAVEQCYRRLSRADRKQTRKAMLGFYRSLRDFSDLKALLPAKPRQWLEVPLEMEIYLRLKRPSKAKALVKWCESKLDPKKRFTYEVPLRSSLAQYCAHVRKYDRAIEHLSEMDTSDLSKYGNDLDLVSLRLTEALLIALRYRKEISGSDAPSIDPMKHHLSQTIRRLQSALSSQLPTSDCLQVYFEAARAR